MLAMRILKRKTGWLAALLLLLLGLSGCISTSESVTINIKDEDTLEANEQIYLLFNDGTTATTAGQEGLSSITINNPDVKTIVGAWVYDSVAGVSWVPDYYYGNSTIDDFNSVYISNISGTKPQIPAAYAVLQGEPKLFTSTDGKVFYDVTFALYGAGENAPLVDGRTGVFAQTTDQVTFMDLDPQNTQNQGSTVTEGLASFTQNGLVTFRVKSAAFDPNDPQISSIPFALKTASGFIPIYTQADLSGLTLSEGELSPSFDRSVTSYTANVANDVESLMVTASVYDSVSTIIVNGEVADNGTASGAIDLTVGANPIEIDVTAEDGTKKTYTVTVTREPYVPSSDATLSGLSVSEGTLTPGFDGEVAAYSVDVASDVESLTVTPTATDSKAMIIVGEEEVDSGTASGAIDLAVGANKVEIVVTAEDGTKKTYTVTVTRAEPYVPSGDATLSGLSLSEGMLTPSFDAEVTAYSVNVASDVESLTVTPTATDSKAKIIVGEEKVDSGEASGAIDLAVGANPIKIVVTAENGTKKSYTVTVVRAEPYVPSGDATLSGLSLSEGMLTPSFDAEVTAYSVNVASDVESLTVTPTATDSKAKIIVGEEKVDSGEASGAIDLAVGANKVEIVVTAENGTKKSYTVTVVRAEPYVPSSDAKLSGLSLSEGTLTPSFDAEVASYSVDVASDVESLTVTPTATDSKAKIIVGEEKVDSGTASGAIELAIGANEIEIVVMAENGTKKTYTVTVTRAEPYVPSGDATLSGLSLSEGMLTPSFDAEVTAYSVNVASDVESLTVTPTATDSKAKIIVGEEKVDSGTVSGAIDLAVGANPIKIVVTAEDGTKKTYAVTVVRAQPYVPSGDATLSGLSVSEGKLTPSFDASVTSYAVDVANSVTSLSVTSAVYDNTASISVNDVVVDSGTASGAIDLAVGANPIKIVVTAENGTEKTYTVTVTRAEPYVPSGDATLSGLSVSEGTLTPSYDAEVATYSVDVESGVESLTVTPTVSDGKATVTVDDEEVDSGTASGAIDLAVGANKVKIVVTAEDGTKKTYTVTVVRAQPYVPSGDATLSGLSVSEGKLTPSFDASVTSYAVDLANSVASLSVTAVVYDNTASISVNDVVVASGTASGAIDLNVGANVIRVVVTAEDSSTKTYTVTVTRAAGGGSGIVVTVPSTEIISSANGSLTLPAGRVGQVSLDETITIQIPANATNRELKLIIEKVAETQPLFTNKEVLASSVYEILKNFPENFANPVTLTFVFDPSSLEEGQKPSVFYFDETKKEWVEVGGKAEGNRISVEVDHFTKYAVLAVGGTGETEAPEVSFGDISGHWAVAQIKQATSLGIVSGYEDGTFKPAATVTRAEFAVMLMNALKLDSAAAELSFSDAAKVGAWARTAVSQAVQAGVITGYADGTFRPDAKITRAEMAAMIAKALKASFESNASTGFKDDGSIPAWARSAVSAIEKLGLIKGNNDGQFLSNAQTTRAEAVTVLLRMLELSTK
ncbi:cadherin-like beta sandwich domain-containing protein [Cohnella thailandensis]|uniref:Cadherin-like beta sandwich domain-containing protein n=1 Tax=Cohnella thailandensis TaxID=557557 RepID=A0A841SV24_9BACL|nr:cadherin-like beta sandwich domain-containing protein [Cohnella thailandensis]MBB6635764.1 cadherin-like beta sandwich domain-containing protein [Cohnella thailandensis]MBP1976142.1 tRNA threonylcarbamoyladenosine modification (KEOPS) complex Pcc1 subunit [Cohnella thailandensis]